MDSSNHRIGLQHWAKEGIADIFAPHSTSILYHSQHSSLYIRKKPCFISFRSSRFQLKHFGDLKTGRDILIDYVR